MTLRRVRVDTAAPAGESVLTVRRDGGVGIRGVRFQIGRERIGEEVRTIWDPETIMFFDAQGTLLIEHPWPDNDTRYVSNGRPPGRPKNPANPEPSPMS
ncbi:hypothetical protein ACFWN7_12250 [Agromyces sp. NPDC058484]|uniref:hypothetical protein n=1 Tax=Agromyces sp. NPDC058484 TaxID=3346524 RepID=UPI003668F8E7